MGLLQLPGEGFGVWMVFHVQSGNAFRGPAAAFSHYVFISTVYEGPYNFGNWQSPVAGQFLKATAVFLFQTHIQPAIHYDILYSTIYTYKIYG